MSKNLQQLIEKIKEKKIEVIILVIIFSFGIFFRTYNFSKWLHFEIDQTYDTKIVSQAIEKGPGNLTLLGPTAGGGRALRLGPSFYYLEYLSALVFGDNPTGHAMVVLLLNIALLPLFFFFCKRYFSDKLSIALAAIISFSFYFVVYSRFSWSPNVLPFLVVAILVAFLLSVDKQQSKREFWFLVGCALFAITTQIHFNAFFVMPAIIGSFLIIKRPSFKLKTWFFGLLIIAFIYSPVIVNDIKTHGENISYFFAKFDRIQANKKSGYLKTFAQTLQQDAAAYYFIDSSMGKFSSKKPTGYSLQSNNSTSLAYWSGIVFLLCCLAVLIRNVYIEKKPARKDFLIIIALWFFWSTLYFFSLMDKYRVYPRFFLLISPLAIIFAGLLLEKLDASKSKIKLSFFLATIVVILGANANGIYQYFEQYKKNSFAIIPTDDAFPDTHRITLSDQMEVVNYIESKAKENGKPVLIKSLPEFEPVYWYFLNKANIHYIDEIQPGVAYSNVNYFAINNIPPSIVNNFDIIENKIIGQINVFYLKPKPALALTQLPSNKNYLQDQQISELMTWNKLSQPYMPITINKSSNLDSSLELENNSSE